MWNLKLKLFFLEAAAFLWYNFINSVNPTFDFLF